MRMKKKKQMTTTTTMMMMMMVKMMMMLMKVRLAELHAQEWEELDARRKAEKWTRLAAAVAV